MQSRWIKRSIVSCGARLRSSLPRVTAERSRLPDAPAQSCSRADAALAGLVFAPALADTRQAPAAGLAAMLLMREKGPHCSGDRRRSPSETWWRLQQVYVGPLRSLCRDCHNRQWAVDARGGGFCQAGSRILNFRVPVLVHPRSQLRHKTPHRNEYMFSLVICVFSFNMHGFVAPRVLDGI